MWGSYTTGKSLGQGLYGEVREATDSMGQRWAVKKFTENRYGVETPSEVALTLQASHPHIIKAREYFSEGERQYLVMELADMNLRTLVDENKPTEEESVTLLCQVLDALAYLQENRFHHCDIKPENILILQGSAKLADLGLCVYGNVKLSSCQSFTSPQNYFTNNGMYTWQIKRHSSIFAQKADYQASDIWALGVTFVYMLTGKILFYLSEGPLEEFYKFIDDPVSYLEALVDKKWLDLLIKMLHPDQKQRLHLAKDVLALLNKTPLPGLALILYNLDITVTVTKNLYTVIDWLEEVFEEIKLPCHDAAATIACFYYVFDDLTDKGRNGKIMQCLGCACLFLMNKTYSFTAVNPEDLVYYSADVFTKKELYEMERRVFDKLGGRVLFHTLATLAFSRDAYYKAKRALLYSPKAYSTTNLVEYMSNLEFAESVEEKNNRELVN
ncbi:Serine/Threonine protein kinase [Cedratvirus Zaza IHUMI]|uniref:Serine/Threonine protein kinase n=1 Tax=Cedratvirus Zaza IHUMI TaxID=2126979 RepID=A0A2R8FFU7_9VIRU|nr:Serine/Threonine protein kinase [Cedratvirus Zaza IHUMI]